MRAMDTLSSETQGVVSTFSGESVDELLTMKPMSQLTLQQVTGLTGPRRGTRRARVQDVSAIRGIVEPLVRQRRMVALRPVTFYESLQRFRVIEAPQQGVIGCGALQVVWDELAEIRTIAVSPESRGSGAGSELLRDLLYEGQELGVRRVFCQTFAVHFFSRHGFVPTEVESVSPDIYAELLRGYDHDVAQSLDLARVRPITLGNTCMVRSLD